MAIRDEKVIEIAKLLSNNSDTNIHNSLWDNYLKPYLKTCIPGAFNKILTSHAVYPYQKVCYISSRYKPINRIYTDSGDWVIIDDNVVLALDSDLNKLVNITIEWGTDSIVEDVEAVCGRILTELYLKVTKNAFGVESISNSFDVTTLTTKFQWSDWEEFQKMLKRYWVSTEKEAGCLV